VCAAILAAAATATAILRLESWLGWWDWGVRGLLSVLLFFPGWLIADTLLGAAFGRAGRRNRG